MYNVYILLGGNTGDVPATFSEVLNAIKDLGIVPVLTSSIYLSEPWGMEGDKLFCNQAALVKTSLSPGDLIKVLLDTERSFGRRRIKGVTGNRSIDIDILFYDDRVIDIPGLIIPHPRMHLRNFALIPMLEIAPEKVHPLLGKTVRQLCRETDDRLWVRKAKGSGQNT